MDDMIQYETPLPNRFADMLEKSKFHVGSAKIPDGPLTEDDLASLMELVIANPNRESTVTDYVTKSNQGMWKNIWHGFLQIIGQNTNNNYGLVVTPSPEERHSPVSSIAEDRERDASLSNWSICFDKATPRWGDQIQLPTSSSAAPVARKANLTGQPSRPRLNLSTSANAEIGPNSLPQGTIMYDDKLYNGSFLVQHLESLNQWGRSFVCPFCDKLYQRRRWLENHIKNKHSRL